MKKLSTPKAILLTTAFLMMLNVLGTAQTSTTKVAIPESTVREKLKDLGKLTPIALDYNKIVQAYIDVYTIKRRDHLQRIIERSNLYFPLFEEYLSRYNLPMELKYLAIVESALDPKAQSTSGAMGLWQFLYQASKMFDLEVNTYVDERCDPVKSTEAACKYLQYLYRNFNDWHLALAAYNVGIGEVKKAIERSGGKRNFWELSPYLPEAARSYVPAFIAANYVMNNYTLYNITNLHNGYHLSDIDTVTIDRSLTFEQISRTIDLKVEDIAQLNPMYLRNYIPVTGQNVTIVLPVVKIPIFIRQLKQMKGDTAPLAYDWGNAGKGSKVKVIHTVQRGEYFHKVAMAYRCNVEDIMTWNNLKSKDLRAGQLLTIYTISTASPYFFVCDEVNYTTLYISQLQNNYNTSSSSTEEVICNR